MYFFRGDIAFKKKTQPVIHWRSLKFANIRLCDCPTWNQLHRGQWMIRFRQESTPLVCRSYNTQDIALARLCFGPARVPPLSQHVNTNELTTVAYTSKTLRLLLARGKRTLYTPYLGISKYGDPHHGPWLCWHAHCPNMDMPVWRQSDVIDSIWNETYITLSQ